MHGEILLTTFFLLLFFFLDFDPEALDEENWVGGGSDDDEEGSSGEEEEEEGHDGREHYVAVGYACRGYQFPWVVPTADEKKKNKTARANCGRDRQSC